LKKGRKTASRGINQIWITREGERRMKALRRGEGGGRLLPLEVGVSSELVRCVALIKKRIRFSHSCFRPEESRPGRISLRWKREKKKRRERNRNRIGKQRTGLNRMRQLHGRNSRWGVFYRSTQKSSRSNFEGTRNVVIRKTTYKTPRRVKILARNKRGSHIRGKTGSEDGLSSEDIRRR